MTASPPPPPDRGSEPRVRAKCHIVFRGILLPNGQMAAGMTYVDPGDLLPRSHPAVRARPENFELDRMSLDFPCGELDAACLQ